MSGCTGISGFIALTGINFNGVTDGEIAEAETLLNNRPSVVLDGLNPLEVVSGVVHDAMNA